MRDVKAFVYENLNPQQRVSAALEAMARKDDAELQKLTRTCPQKTYRMSDLSYAESLQLLLADSLAFECSMNYLAINYLLLLLRGSDVAHQWVDQMSLLQAAWDATMKERGVDPTTLARAGCPRHPVIDFLLELAALPSPEVVQAARTVLLAAQQDRRHL